jgi:hypothetical protein
MIQHISIVLLCLAYIAEGKTVDFTPVTYVVVSLICLAIFVGLGVMYRRLFPLGCPRIFDEIEMEDIYLQNLDDEEANLKNRITDLKDQLNFHRKRKTANIADNDMRMLPIERQGLLKRRGEDIFDEIGWDETPKKATSIDQRSPSPPRSDGNEKSKTDQEQHSETDEDMWAQWEKVRTDKPNSNNGNPVTNGKTIPTALSPAATASMKRVESILGQKTVSIGDSPFGKDPTPRPTAVSATVLAAHKGVSASAKKRMEAYREGGGVASPLQPLLSPPPKVNSAMEGMSISGGLGESFSQKNASGYSINVNRPSMENSPLKPLLQKMVDNSKRNLDQSVKAAIQKNLIGKSARPPPSHIKPPMSPPPPNKLPLTANKGPPDMSIQRRPPPPRGPPPPELLKAMNKST